MDTFEDVYSMKDAMKFPEDKEYDFTFNPKQHKQELEVWYNKIMHTMHIITHNENSHASPSL